MSARHTARWRVTGAILHKRPAYWRLYGLGKVRLAQRRRTFKRAQATLAVAYEYGSATGSKACGGCRRVVLAVSGENVGMHRQVVLKTERLQVTTWVPEDIDDLHRLHADPVTMRWVRSGRPETRAETETLLASYRSQQRDRGWTKWRLADQDNVFIGRAGFGPHDDGDGRELGYTLRPDLWGNGLATEIAAGLVEWHHRNSDVPLWAFAALENAASRRVLEKVGFSLVSDDTEHDDGMPCALYRIDG